MILRTDLLKPEDLVGKTEQEVVSAINDINGEYRVLERNGEEFASTDNFKSQRYNLRVKDNVVFEVTFG